MNNFKSGALLDKRTEKERLKDYLFEETVSAVKPVKWIEKTVYRKFPIFNQDGSGSCVAQTMAKLLGVMYWLDNQEYVHFSATDIYQQRSNKPSGGMSGTEVFKIAQKGVTLEVLVPSQNMNDNQMDSVKIEKYKKEVGKIFKFSNYIIDPVKDIETIASIIQKTGKAVMVWFYFNHDEWTDIPKIKRTLRVNGAGVSRHSVSAVDFTLHNGKKCLIIDDSWGTQYGANGQRIITEDFFKERNFFAGHAMNFIFDTDLIPEKYIFTKTMKYGDKNNEVKELQKYLKGLKYFPINISATGYFGSITKQSVIKFQLAHNLVGDGVVGTLTLSVLNK